jgi:hypothetical protein
MELPESILRYAVRTHESVILDDGLTPNPFSTDRGSRPIVPNIEGLRDVPCLTSDLLTDQHTRAEYQSFQILASPCKLGEYFLESQELCG